MLEEFHVVPSGVVSLCQATQANYNMDKMVKQAGQSVIVKRFGVRIGCEGMPGSAWHRVQPRHCNNDAFPETWLVLG